MILGSAWQPEYHADVPIDAPLFFQLDNGSLWQPGESPGDHHDMCQSNMLSKFWLKVDFGKFVNN